MDLLNMLQTARVLDTDGDLLGEVLAIQILGGQLAITIITEEEEVEGDDGGGEEISPEEMGELRLIRPIKEALGGSHG